MNRKIKVVTLSSIAVILLAGCGVGGKQIIVPTYLPPKEAGKVKGITNGNGDNKGKFISFAINKVKSEVPVPKGTDRRIINITQEAVTESNYILLHPVYNSSHNGLDILVTKWEFPKPECDQNECILKTEMELAFTIYRGSVPYITKIYPVSKTRSTEKRTKMNLPSEMTLSAEMIKESVEGFISDISPQKTNQLRELKSLPTEIAYLLDMAPAGNYQEIINKMEKYKGDKDASFYYDLAVFYEALAAKSEELGFLEKANINYQKSMDRGGSSDSVIVSTKARFDNFYNIFKKLVQQRSINQKQENSINEDYNTKE